LDMGKDFDRSTEREVTESNGGLYDFERRDEYECKQRFLMSELFVGNEQQAIGHIPS